MDLALLFLIFLAFFLVGDKVCRSWPLSFSGPTEAFVFCSSLGLIIVSFLILLLAFLHWITPATLWILLGSIYLCFMKRWTGFLKNFPDWWNSLAIRSIPKGDWFERLNFWILAILVLLAFTLAMTPPIMTDALVYHLAVPKTFLENHGLVNLPNNIHSYFPQLFEMIFLFCLGLGTDSLAKLCGLGMVLILLSALALYFKQTFSSRYAIFVPVLYFSTPTFFSISSSAYVDIQAASFIFLSFFSWDLWIKRKQEGWLLLMIVFALSAVSTKLSSAIVLPLVLLGIAWKDKKHSPPHRALRHILLLALITLLLLSPWWARNWYYTGNPFAPFLIQFFGGEDRFNWDLGRSLMLMKFFRLVGMGKEFTDFLLLPINLTFFAEKNSIQFDGHIGILYFLLLPALLRIPRQAFPAGILFLIFILFWFVHFQYVRFLAPSFTFLAILTVAGLERWTREPVSGDPGSIPQSVWKKWVPVGVVTGLIFNLGGIIKEWDQIRPLPYIAGIESRDRFLTRHIPSYPLFQTVNRELNEDAVVLFVYMRNLGYLSDRKFISDTFFEAHTLQTILKTDSTPKGIARQLESAGITHLLFDHNFVFGKNSAFSMKERERLKLFLDIRARQLRAEKGYYLYQVSQKIR
ncbi:MAG: hypothetical protein VX667_06615 [Nitrospinota bacterium]|nr:hypothetical protein [Nitrospinota bacterium]